jgi:protein translocase SecG subunit
LLPIEFARKGVLCYNAPTLARKGNAVGPYLNVIQIIISLTLIVLVLIQTKGDTGAGVFGGAGVTRTRRGLELRLYQITIILSALFLLISFLSAFLAVRS